MAVSKNFRVTLNLSNFFSDHRCRARIFINEKIQTIQDLEDRIIEIFGTCNFYLVSQNEFLPPSEDVRILHQDDIIWVMKNGQDYNTKVSDVPKVKKDKISGRKRALEEPVDEELQLPKKKKKKKKCDSINLQVCKKSVEKSSKTRNKSSLVVNADIKRNSLDPIKEEKRKSKTKSILPEPYSYLDIIPQEHTKFNKLGSTSDNEGKEFKCKGDIARGYKKNFTVPTITEKYLEQKKTNIVKIEYVNGGSAEAKCKPRIDNITDIKGSKNVTVEDMDISNGNVSVAEAKPTNCLEHIKKKIDNGDLTLTENWETQPVVKYIERECSSNKKIYSTTDASVNITEDDKKLCNNLKKVDNENTAMGSCLLPANLPFTDPKVPFYLKAHENKYSKDCISTTLLIKDNINENGNYATFNKVCSSNKEQPTEKTKDTLTDFAETSAIPYRQKFFTFKSMALNNSELHSNENSVPKPSFNDINKVNTIKNEIIFSRNNLTDNQMHNTELNTESESTNKTSTEKGVPKKEIIRIHSNVKIPVHIHVEETELTKEHDSIYRSTAECSHLDEKAIKENRNVGFQALIEDTVNKVCKGSASQECESNANILNETVNNTFENSSLISLKETVVQDETNECSNIHSISNTDMEQSISSSFDISGITKITDSTSRYFERKQRAGVGQILEDLRSNGSVTLEETQDSDCSSFVHKRRRKRTRKCRKKNVNASFSNNDDSVLITDAYIPKPMNLKACPAIHIKFGEDGENISTVDLTKNEKEADETALSNIEHVVINADESSIQFNLSILCQEENILKAPSMKTILPKVNDYIAFKVLRITENYTPEKSSFITGKVTDFDTETREIEFKILNGLDQCLEPKGKLSIETEDNCTVESNIHRFGWADLIEPRLLYP